MTHIKLTLLITIFLNLLLANENNYIDIPCAEYKKGAMWRTHLSSRYMNSYTTTFVKSAYKNKILIVDRVRSSKGAIRGSSSFVTTLKKDGNTIYVESKKSVGNRVKKDVIYSPPIPLCGKVPKEFSYLVLNKGAKSTKRIKYSVSLKQIGNRKISTPAGKFNTIVYKRYTRMQTKGVHSTVKLKIVTTEYYAKKVGVVRENTTVTSIVPKHTSKATYNIELVSYKIPVK